MKKNIKLLLITLLFSLSMIFIGCTKECTEHIDNNKDGLCDNCEVEVEVECTEHVDEDHNRRCDICGEKITVVCTAHTDLDSDGYCDICREVIKNDVEEKPTPEVEVCPICEGLVQAEKKTYDELESYTPTTFDASSIYYKKTTEVGDGVTQYVIEFFLNNGRKSQVVATEVDLTKASIVAGTTDNSTSTLSVSKIINQANAYEASTANKVLVAMNADFFGGNLCVNAFVKDSVIVKPAHNDNGSYDYTNLASDLPASMPMLFGVSGTASQIAPIIYSDSVEETVKSKLFYELLISDKDNLYPVEHELALNAYIGTTDKVNLVNKTSRYTKAFAQSTVLKVERHGSEDRLHGKIVEVEKIAEDKSYKATTNHFYVIVPEAISLNNLEVGKYVSYHVNSEDNTWRYYDTIIGCRQALVLDGKVASTVKKENSNGAQSTNIPRSAIGIKSDGTVVLFSVEALRYGAKNYKDEDPYGLSLPQLADFMRYYGIYNGANFDGGGSTQLITRSGYNGSGDFEVVVRSSDYGTSSLTASRSVINTVLVVLKENKTEE